MRASRKDQTLLEQAYQSILEGRMMDDGLGHGGYTMTPDEGHDQGSAAGAGVPKYTKMATGKDHPKIDEWLHTWFTKSNFFDVEGKAGPTYWQQVGDIPDENIEEWFRHDGATRKFFMKNKPALIRAAVKMTQR